MSKSGDKILSSNVSLNSSSNFLGQKVEGMQCAVVLYSLLHSQYLQPTKKTSSGQTKLLLKSCLDEITVGGFAVRTFAQRDFSSSIVFNSLSSKLFNGVAVITPEVYFIFKG